MLTLAALSKVADSGASNPFVCPLSCPALWNIAGFVPTPAPLADELLDWLDLEPGDRLVDPQAGSGAILDRARERGIDTLTTQAIEVAPKLREMLELKGYELIGSDCTDWHPAPEERPNKIAMNPPFENMQDADLIVAMYSRLAPGGILAAITSASPHFQSTHKAIAFRNWLDGEVESAVLDDAPPTVLYCEQNAPDAFKPRNIQTYTIVLRKPETTSKVIDINSRRKSAQPPQPASIAFKPSSHPVAAQLSLF